MILYTSAHTGSYNFVLYTSAHVGFSRTSQVVDGEIGPGGMVRNSYRLRCGVERDFEIFELSSGLDCVGGLSILEIARGGRGC